MIQKSGKIGFAIAACILMLVCMFGMASAEQESICVSTVDEFLEALASDTEIVLASGEYNLTQAKRYGRGGGDYYHWESVFDGYELILDNVENLTIRGENPFDVSIVTEPRYSNVLSFKNASNVTVSDVTLGHTKEKGACSGGVLVLSGCKDVEILSTRMFGCGTRGMDISNCRNVHVDCSDVYECSEGCVYISGSYNVLMENSKFFNCQVWNGVFEVYSSGEIAFINSEVYGNYGAYEDAGCLIASDCPSVYLGGLDVHDNVFANMFASFVRPVTVERCRFFGSASNWANALYPVDQDGKDLTGMDLMNMTMRTVRWEPAALPQPGEVELGEDGKIHVSTVDEFLNAIRNDATIYLEPGMYDLSTASSYGSYGGEYYHWESTYDGPELVIHEVSNLTIEGAGIGEVTIAAVPRYANVLRFDNTYGLILRGFTAGHTFEPGACSGGVLQFIGCGNTIVEGCSLYGCGIVGVWAMYCNNLDVTGTEIYECSSGAAWFSNCNFVRMNHCNVHDIHSQFLYEDYGSTDVLIDGKTIYELM